MSIPKELKKRFGTDVLKMVLDLAGYRGGLGDELELTRFLYHEERRDLCEADSTKVNIELHYPGKGNIVVSNWRTHGDNGLVSVTFKDENGERLNWSFEEGGYWMKNSDS